ncbi:MAG: hypothetical protein V7647_2650 [Acidobacteriota bacterium]|jgi:hypothetical protein
MHGRLQLIRRTLWLACVCLVPGTARATAASLTACDFDGDGHRDRVRLESRDPAVLRVWLSGEGTTFFLRAGSLIQGITVRDLDGDRRDELIVGGSSGLQIWTSAVRGLKPFPPGEPGRRCLSRPVRYIADAPDAVPEPLLGSDALPFALAMAARPRPPLPAAGQPPRHKGGTGAAGVVTPFAPRPPPLAL